MIQEQLAEQEIEEALSEQEDINKQYEFLQTYQARG
jgi:hypothetical protein